MHVASSSVLTALALAAIGSASARPMDHLAGPVVLEGEVPQQQLTQRAPQVLRPGQQAHPIHTFGGHILPEKLVADKRAPEVLLPGEKPHPIYIDGYLLQNKLATTATKRDPQVILPGEQFPHAGQFHGPGPAILPDGFRLQQKMTDAKRDQQLTGPEQAFATAVSQGPYEHQQYPTDPYLAHFGGPGPKVPSDGWGSMAQNRAQKRDPFVLLPGERPLEHVPAGMVALKREPFVLEPGMEPIYIPTAMQGKVHALRSMPLEVDDGTGVHQVVPDYIQSASGQVHALRSMPLEMEQDPSVRPFGGPDHAMPYSSVPHPPHFQGRDADAQAKADLIKTHAEQDQKETKQLQQGLDKAHDQAIKQLKQQLKLQHIDTSEIQKQVAALKKQQVTDSKKAMDQLKTAQKQRTETDKAKNVVLPDAGPMHQLVQQAVVSAGKPPAKPLATPPAKPSATPSTKPSVSAKTTHTAAAPALTGMAALKALNPGSNIHFKRDY